MHAVAADVKPADVKPVPKTGGGETDQNSVDDQLMKALDADLLDEPTDKPATRPTKTSGKPAEKPSSEKTAAEKPTGDKAPGGDPAKPKASKVGSPLDQGDDGEDLGMGEEDGLKRIDRTMRLRKPGSAISVRTPPPRRCSKKCWPTWTS